MEISIHKYRYKNLLSRLISGDLHSRWLYGTNCDVQEKLQRIHNALQEGMIEKSNPDGSSPIKNFCRSLK